MCRGHGECVGRDARSLFSRWTTFRLKQRRRVVWHCQTAPPAARGRSLVGVAAKVSARCGPNVARAIRFTKPDPGSDQTLAFTNFFCDHSTSPHRKLRQMHCCPSAKDDSVCDKDLAFPGSDDCLKGKCVGLEGAAKEGEETTCEWRLHRAIHSGAIIRRTRGLSPSFHAGWRTCDIADLPSAVPLPNAVLLSISVEQQRWIPRAVEATADSRTTGPRNKVGPACQKHTWGQQAAAAAVFALIASR